MFIPIYGIICICRYTAPLWCQCLKSKNRMIKITKEVDICSCTLVTDASLQQTNSHYLNVT